MVDGCDNSLHITVAFAGKAQGIPVDVHRLFENISKRKDDKYPTQLLGLRRVQHCRHYGRSLAGADWTVTIIHPILCGTAAAFLVHPAPGDVAL